MLCRYRCRLLFAEVPKGSDRNAELKLRLRLWEAGEISELVGRVLAQQHSGPLHRGKRAVQPQTDEQRGKRACALTARGSISKAVKRPRGRSGARLGRLSKEPDHSLHPAELGPRNSSHQCGMCRGGACCLGGGRYKAARSAMREQGAAKQVSRHCRMSNECFGTHR